MQEPDLVTFNVGGTLFTLSEANLLQFPETKLARQYKWGKTAGTQSSPEYIDRDPRMFPIILNFYRTSEIHIPPHFSNAAVRSELDYFAIPYTAESFHRTNIGQSWAESTYETVYREICSFFETMFQSSWFQELKKRQLEICWIVGPSSTKTGEMSPCALFFLQTNQQMALKILNTHFGVAGKWRFLKMEGVCERKMFRQYPTKWYIEPTTKYPVLNFYPILNLDEETPQKKRSRKVAKRARSQNS